MCKIFILLEDVCFCIWFISKLIYGLICAIEKKTLYDLLCMCTVYGLIHAVFIFVSN